MTPDGIVERVMNCNRPQGSINITVEDAEEILKLFKEKFEDAWTVGWDDDSSGEVAFVGFFDGTSTTTSGSERTKRNR